MYGPHVGHDAHVSCAAFSHDDVPLLATGSEDRTLCIWALPSPTQHHLRSSGYRQCSHTAGYSDALAEPHLAAQSAVLSAFAISCIAWHPLKAQLLAACRDGDVHVLDVSTGVDTSVARLTCVDRLHLAVHVGHALRKKRVRLGNGTAAVQDLHGPAESTEAVLDLASSTQHVLAMQLVQSDGCSTNSAITSAPGLSAVVEQTLLDSSEWVLVCRNAILHLHGSSFAVKRIKRLCSSETTASSEAAMHTPLHIDPQPGPFLAGCAACAVCSSAAPPAHQDVSDQGRLTVVLGGLLQGDVAVLHISARTSSGASNFERLQPMSGQQRQTGWDTDHVLRPASDRPGSGEHSNTSATAMAVGAWRPIAVFPEQGAPPLSALGACSTSATAGTNLTSKAASQAGKLMQASASTAKSAKDKPVTFHKRIASSGYGMTYDKPKLGQMPPKPRKSGSVDASSRVAALVATQHSYPMHAPPPACATVQPQAAQSPLTALAFAPDGSALACAGRDARVNVLPADALLQRCACSLRRASLNNEICQMWGVWWVIS